MTPDVRSTNGEFQCDMSRNDNVKSNSQNKSQNNCIPTDLNCSQTSQTSLYVHYELDHITYTDENSSIDACLAFIIGSHIAVQYIYNHINHVDNNNSPITNLTAGGINLLISSLHI